MRLQGAILAKLAAIRKSGYTGGMEQTASTAPEVLQPTTDPAKSGHQSITRIMFIIPVAVIATAVITAGVLRLLIPPTPPISPVANADQPAIVRQSLADSHESLAYYVAASQEYLGQARALSQRLGNSQTDSDKQKIIDLLNQSLIMANDAVAYFPQSPEGFATRADLLDTVAAVDPSVKSQADRDRSVAAKLGKGTATAVAPTDLVRAAPLEEASLIKTVAIALPGEVSTAPVTATGADNTAKGTVILKAGEKSVTVSSPDVTAANLVYYTPQGDLHGSILSLSAKNTCDLGSELSKSSEPCRPSFTLSLDTPLATDLVISWWIVK